VLGTISFTFPAGHSKPARCVKQRLKMVRVALKAPWRPDRTLSDATVTALLTSQINPTEGDEPVAWLLLTNLPIDMPEQAVEKIAWNL
jgi:hypothetical protein